MKKTAVPSVLLLVLLLAVAIKAEAQQSPKVPRIGILEPATSASISARIEAFRQGLRDLGYIEGQNITIEYRYADGKSERIPDLADRFHGTYPPNYNEGHHLITGNGTTRYQVVP